MAILKHLPKIKVDYLQAILDDHELYTEVAIEVKQQIWQDNQVMMSSQPAVHRVGQMAFTLSNIMHLVNIHLSKQNA